MREKVREGYSIAIFPEGTRTYDGKMKTVDTKEDYTNDFAGYGSELQIGNANSEIVLVKETSNGSIA